jgi:hypothetical protein
MRFFSMRNSIRFTAALVGAVALTGAGALSATAAPGDTTATVEVTGGPLTISVPASIALTSAAPGATSSNVLSGVAVSDLRAGVQGWVVGVSTTDFTSLATGTAIPKDAVSFTATNTAKTGTVTVAASVPTSLATTIQTATAVSGNNTATWDETLEVAVPADALAATDYTAIITHSFL